MTQPTAVEAIRQAIANQAKSTAGGWLGSSLVAALGAGAGARGLLGLYHMHNNPVQPPAEPLSGSLATDLPLPPEEEEDPRKVKRAQAPAPVQLKPAPGLAPTAQTMKAWTNLNNASAGLRAPTPAPPPRKPSPLDAVAAQLAGGRAPTPAPQPLAAKPMTLAPTTGVPGQPAGPAELSKVQQLRPAPAPTTAITKRSSAYNFLLGDHATTPQGVPWLMPGVMLGGAAAGATGWKLVDYLLDKRRKAEMDTDVDKARGEFQQALLSAYPGQKTAAAGTLGAELDALYDDFEKTAAASDWAGAAAGAAGTGMGMLGMLAALVSYQEASKRSRSSLMNKATTNWQRRMWREQPPAVQVTPKRVQPSAIPQLDAEQEPESAA